MKKIIFISAILFFSQTALRAQPNFEKAMLAGIRQLDTATGNSFLSIANNFERIGNAEKNKWQPFYYAAYAYISMALGSPDKNVIDELADKAESLLKQAEAQEPDNSEISCLFAMINSCRIIVDPVSRFQARGKDVQQYLTKATKEDNSNPRIYLLQGMMQLRTPEAFGGGPRVAKPTMELAVEKFKTFKPKDQFSPLWGNQQAVSVLNKISVNNQ